MYTFRRWSQESKYLPYGQKIDAEMDDIGNGSFCDTLARCFKPSTGKSIELTQDGKIELESYFQSLEESHRGRSLCLREIIISLASLGIFLATLFQVDQIRFVSLLTQLLNIQEIFSSVIFSILIGRSIGMLVISMAWIRQSPLFSVTLLTLTAITLYFLVFFDWYTQLGL